MKYRLTLMAIKGTYNEVFPAIISHEASAELSFPVDATFSTNMIVGNALRELIPILLGEVVQKFEKVEGEE